MKKRKDVDLWALHVFLALLAIDEDLNGDELILSYCSQFNRKARIRKFFDVSVLEVKP